MANGQLSAVLRFLSARVTARADAEATDGQLLRRFVGERSEAAFTALLQRHGPMVLGVCRRLLREPHDAEDAFQATFLVLVRKAGSISKPELLGNWLYGVAYRTALKARAKSARRRSVERQVVDLPAVAPSAAGDWADVRSLLDELIRRLPAKYRVPFVLCYLEGRTNEEAARLLGCPKGTVLSRLARARERLRAPLARQGLAPAGAFAIVLSGGAGFAAVPAALATSTIRAGTLVSAGEAAGAGAVPSRVAALTEGVLKAMLFTRLKVAAAVLLALGVVGGAVFVCRVLTAKPVDVMKESAAAPAAAQELQTVREAHNLKAQKEKPEALAQRAARDKGEPAAAGAWQLRSSLKVPAGAIAMAICPDGRTLAVRGNKATPMTITLWDVVTGQQRATLETETVTSSVAFSPDGKTVAWPEGYQGIALWDVAQGRKLATLKERTPTGFQFMSVAFSPDGKTLAVGGGVVLNTPPAGPGAPAIWRETSAIKLWETATGTERAVLRGHGRRVTSVAFSPDGKSLASASLDGAVKLWDPAIGQERVALRGHTGHQVDEVVFSPDSKLLATASHDHTAKLCDVATGRELLTLRGHTSWVRCVAFVPDGKIVATGAENGVVKLWDVTTGRERASLRVYDRGGVWSVKFACQGKVLATGGAGAVKLWEWVSRPGEEVR